MEGFSFYKNTRTKGNFCVQFGVESQWNSVGEQAIWNFVSQTLAEQESEEFLSDWQLEFGNFIWVYFVGFCSTVDAEANIVN